MLIFVGALLLSLAWRTLHRRRRPRVSLTLRWIGLPVLAALLQIGLGLPFLARASAGDRLSVVLASYALVGCWLIVNAMRAPEELRVSATMICAGWLTNAVAIVANRGMPVSRSALALVGDRRPSVDRGNLFKHVLETPHTLLPWLGDVIPVPVPLLRNVVSLGDVLMCVGAVMLLQRVDVSAGTFSKRPSRSLSSQLPNSP